MGKAPLIIGSVVSTAAVAIGAVVFLSGAPDADVTSARSARAIAPVSPEPGDTPGGRNKALVQAKREVITIASTPPGAVLFKNGQSLGAVPKEVDRPPADGPDQVYVLKRDDHQDQQITITATAPKELIVEMQPVPKPFENIAKEANTPKEDEKRADKRRKRKTEKHSGNQGGDIVNPWD